MREQGHDGGVGGGGVGMEEKDGDLFGSSSSSASSPFESLFAGDNSAGNQGGSILDQHASSSSSSSSAFDILNSFMGSADNTGPTVNPLSAFGDMGNLMNL